MNKMMSIFVMAVSVVFMCVISLVYSFSTIDIPTSIYMVLWCLCIALVRLAASNGSILR